MNGEKLLIVDNVSYFSSGHGSLNDISFELGKGENLVIFGPEYSGLNSVCPVIAGLIAGYEGNISYKGNSIKGYNYIMQHNYRKELGYLQSNYGLINNMTVRGNISLPLEYHSSLSEKEIHGYVDNLIDELNLDHCKSLRPVDLLKSELLKTAYARAIALDPDLLLVEHALEGQCLLNAQTFLESVKKRSFVEHKSIIFVTYEPERFVHYSNRFLMLYQGNVVFSGTRDDFINAENYYLSQYMNTSTEGPMVIL